MSYTDDTGMISDVRKYREAVGSLIYQATCARPDLSFIVSKLLQYFTKPREEQWTSVKRTEISERHNGERVALQEMTMRNLGYKHTVMQIRRLM